MWFPGTIIVCVDDSSSPGHEYKEVGMDNGIRKNQMYTVRSYAESVSFYIKSEIYIPGVWLNEVRRIHIINPPSILMFLSSRNKDPNDMPYASRRFRILESIRNEREVYNSVEV